MGYTRFDNNSQFYDEAKSLFVAQKNLPEHEQSERHLLASKKLLEYSKTMPSETTRTERLHEKLKTNKNMQQIAADRKKGREQDYEL